MPRTPLALLLATAGAALCVVPLPPAAAAVPPALPTRAAALQAATTALDTFYAGSGGATADAGWRWAPYFMGMEAVLDATGDPAYRTRLQAWGDRSSWLPTAPASPTSNPDSRAAVQVWQDAAADGVPADLGPSDRMMAADLGVPASTYWWVDSLFMGLPLWTRWAARTGDPAYAAKGAAFYGFLKTDGRTPYRTGCTGTGLWSAAQGLWWRDCAYVGQRDALGHEVFWARGNGWVLGAMARTLMAMGPADPQRAEYVSVLQRMSARLATLQGADGMWRSSLLSPSLYPAPETSGSALFTYAMAYGVRAGLLDRATYLPVVQRAWAGLAAQLQPGGLTGCQGVGEAPGPVAATPVAYCVGAFALAATEVAQLAPLAADGFARTLTGGWGTAEAGGGWTATPPGAFSVAGGAGRVATGAGDTRTAVLSGVSSAATDVAATVTVAPTTAGSTYVAVLGRTAGPASYAGRVVVAPGGAVRLQLRRGDTTLAQAAVPSSAGGRLRVRVQVAGGSPTTLRARAWDPALPEPATWQLVGTDAAAGLQGPGGVGVTTYLSAGASPAQVAVGVDSPPGRG